MILYASVPDKDVHYRYFRTLQLLLRRHVTRRATSPHLPLTLDDDASPHEGMYLAEVPLLPRALEGVCIALSFTQSS
jgi:hypothetical protein